MRKIKVKQIKRHSMGDYSVTVEDIAETLCSLDKKTYKKLLRTVRLIRLSDRIAIKALEEIYE